MKYTLQLNSKETITIWELLKEHGIKKPIGTNLVGFSIKTYDSDCHIEYEGDFYEKAFSEVIKSGCSYKKNLRTIRGSYRFLHAECLYLKTDKPIELIVIFE